MGPVSARGRCGAGEAFSSLIDPTADEGNGNDAIAIFAETEAFGEADMTGLIVTAVSVEGVVGVRGVVGRAREGGGNRNLVRVGKGAGEEMALPLDGRGSRSLLGAGVGRGRRRGVNLLVETGVVVVFSVVGVSVVGVAVVGVSFAGVTFVDVVVAGVTNVGVTVVNVPVAFVGVSMFCSPIAGSESADLVVAVVTDKAVADIGGVSPALARRLALLRIERPLCWVLDLKGVTSLLF